MSSSALYGFTVVFGGRAADYSAAAVGTGIAINKGSSSEIIGEIVGALPGGLGTTLVSTVIKSPGGPSLGDILDLAAAITRMIPGGQPLSVLLTVGGIAYDIYEFNNRPRPETNTDFENAQNWRPPARDPLVLDLDADGIETVGIDANSPVLFDHDGDGTKNATGWIRADDGIVVLDRNGNGLIDSGRELFGDNTVLQNGTRAGQIATNGYEALADVDANGDGRINSSDAVFSQLRVWQDANQDGISQASELRTLSALGIASLSTTGQASNINLGGGNTQPFSGTFNWANGGTGTSGGAGLSASLLLASNNFYREFTDNPPLTVDAQDLPQMGGSGWVRDLREAMSLSDASAEALESAVAQVAATTTRSGQRALVDELLSDWAATSGRLVTSVGRYNLVAEGGIRVTRTFTSAEVGDIVLRLNVEGMMTTTGIGLTAAGEEVLRRLNVLEVFNGSKFLQQLIPPPIPSTGVVSGGGGGGGGGSGAAMPAPGATYMTATLFQGQVDLLNQSYEKLAESVYGALATQTRLRPYLDQIDSIIDESGIRFDSSGLAQRLADLKLTNETGALDDLVDLLRYQSGTLDTVGFDGLSMLRNWVGELPVGSPLRVHAVELGVVFGAISVGTLGSDIYLGNASADSYSGSAGNDMLDGGAGADSLGGGDGNDIVMGRTGNDYLYGEAGNDSLQGQDDSDYLSGGAGNDMLDGGAGNDYLQGDAGADVYRFGRGGGQDVINNYEAIAAGGTKSIDTIVVDGGIAPSDIVLTRNWFGDLILTIDGSADSVRVSNYFANDGATSYAVDEIRFANGTVWRVADVKALALVANEAGSTLYGFESNDVIAGAVGNDVVYARQSTELKPVKYASR